MKQLKIVFTASLLFFGVMNSCSQQNDPDASSILGVFVASTPCSNGTRPLPGIAVNTDCELIKWKLTLYQNEVTKSPTTYKIHALYGLPKQGTKGLMGGGKKIEMEGKWTIIKGTASDRNVIIYQLNDIETSKSISFIKLNDNLLHLLDSEQHLMIGNAGWSYTFNRKDK